MCVREAVSVGGNHSGFVRSLVLCGLCLLLILTLKNPERKNRVKWVVEQYDARVSILKEARERRELQGSASFQPVPVQPNDMVIMIMQELQTFSRASDADSRAVIHPCIDAISLKIKCLHRAALCLDSCVEWKQRSSAFVHSILILRSVNAIGKGCIVLSRSTVFYRYPFVRARRLRSAPVKQSLQSIPTGRIIPIPIFRCHRKPGQLEHLISLKHERQIIRRKPFRLVRMRIRHCILKRSSVRPVRCHQ